MSAVETADRLVKFEPGEDITANGSAVTIGSKVVHDGLKTYVSSLQNLDDLERGVVRLWSERGGCRFTYAQKLAKKSPPRSPGRKPLTPEQRAAAVERRRFKDRERDRRRRPAPRHGVANASKYQTPDFASQNRRSEHLKLRKKRETRLGILGKPLPRGWIGKTAGQNVYRFRRTSCRFRRLVAKKARREHPRTRRPQSRTRARPPDYLPRR